MQIDIDREQYELLVRAAVLGQLLYGTLETTKGDRFGKIADGYEALESILMGHADAFDLGWLRDTMSGRQRLAGEHLDAIEHDLDRYDDRIFWDLAIEYFARRDLERLHGPERVAAMDDEEYRMQTLRVEEQWETEFRDHGIGRLEVRKEE